MKLFTNYLLKTLVIVFLCIGLSALSAEARPKFQMPFPCNQSWSCATYTSHNPLYAADFNCCGGCNSDLGKKVVASYKGTVKTSAYSTTSGYGNYVVIDHGNGWTTWYCHLNSRSVGKGQKVTRGQKIGTVGNSSAKYNLCAHLHYEQRLNNVVKKIYFNGSQIPYYKTVTLKSKNCTSTVYKTGTVKTSGAPLNIRSGPSTSYSVVGTVANGSKVTIYCQTYGQRISGPYGTTTVWDRIGAGKYVSDAYIYTGSDGLVAPLCK